MADDKKFLEPVEGVSRSMGTKDAESLPIERQPPNKQKFDELFGKEEPAIVRPIDDGAKTTIFDEVQQVTRKADEVYKAAPKDIAGRAEHLIAEIESLKQKLSAPNVELKDSMQTLLQNRLTHIDENIRIALSKVGVDYEPTKIATKPENPIERFLGMLTEGQGRLEKLSNDIEKLGVTGRLDPSVMLMLQVKVGYIQQEVEFFSSLLNKALESTKTIMNVQV